MQRPLVLFTDVTDLDIAPAKRILAAQGIDSQVMLIDDAEVIDPSQFDAIGLIVGYRNITAALMGQLPGLQFIGTTSNGVDMVDLGYAEEHNLWVTNVGHAATEEVAVHTMALVLSAVRHQRESLTATATGGWTADVAAVPRRMSEMTLGLIGYGKIGRKVANLAAPFFAKIVAYDPVQDWAGEVATQIDLDNLLRESHIVSLHVPLTPETRGILNTTTLAQLQHGSILINVSRGELVEEAALTAALDDGTVGTACLDVLDQEPPARDHPFRAHPKVLLTPHIAFLSDASLREYEEAAARNIAEWWRGEFSGASVLKGLPPRQNMTPSSLN